MQFLTLKNCWDRKLHKGTASSLLISQDWCIGYVSDEGSRRLK